MASFYDANGQLQQVEGGLNLIKAACDSKESLRSMVNRAYPTNADKYGETFHQMCASEGIFFANSKAAGISAPMLADMLEGRSTLQAGGVVVKEANPGSRWLFMPALMEAVEDKLVSNYQANVNSFEGLLAMDTVVANDRVEQPVLNFAKPEAARSQAISQLALPSSMLSITTSDRVFKIPTRSLGIEWSDQAAKATSLDLIALAIARQKMVEQNENANAYVLQLLNGDLDLSYGGAALSTISNKVVKASSFDSTVVTAGALSQKAWMKWLYKNSKRRTIDWIITDIDGAMAIENRTGKPIITGDNPNSPRIDTLLSVSNPGWAGNVRVFITDDANWPANTIVGIDSRAAVARVRSSTAEYSAQEAFVLKRSSAMRFDYGEIVYRLFDDAFEVLSLVP